MVQVTVGNNLKRDRLIVDSNTTLRSILEDAGTDYTRGVMNLDGSTLNPGDLNKTLAELGYTGEPNRDKCFLLNVVKADNA